jgi:type VI protein secretion system component Hcp
MFMEGIDGDSAVTSKEIDITGFSYSADAPPRDPKSSGNSSAGSPMVSIIQVSKPTCSATPKIENQFFSGKPIPKVILKEYKPDADNKPAAFIIVTLENVCITHHMVQNHGYEQLTLDPATIQRQFMKQDPKTNALSDAGTTKFDRLSKVVSS